MEAAVAGRRGRRALPALLIPLAISAAFAVAARWVAEAPPLAIWGGAVWVFLLSTIVTLPLLGSGAAPPGE